MKNLILAPTFIGTEIGKLDLLLEDNGETMVMSEIFITSSQKLSDLAILGVTEVELINAKRFIDSSTALLIKSAIDDDYIIITEESSHLEAIKTQMGIDIADIKNISMDRVIPKLNPACRTSKELRYEYDLHSEVKAYRDVIEDRQMIFCEPTQYVGYMNALEMRVAVSFLLRTHMLIIGELVA
jgi:hypothetical protein